MGSYNQLLFLVTLKLYQKLGYFIKVIDCPQIILETIAGILKIQIPNEEFISCYDNSRQRQRHIEYIRKALKIKLLDKKSLFNIARRIAKTKEALIDIINGIVEELVQNNNELPGFSTIETCANKARSFVNDNYYKAIYKRLPSKKRKIIQKEILIYDAKRKSVWNQLKLEPSKPTAHNIRIFAQHVRWLKDVGLSAYIFEDIPKTKLDPFFEESFALNFYKIRRIKEQKRIAMVAVVVYQLTIRATDDLIDMIIRLYNDLENNARSDLLQYKIDRVKQADELIETFNNVLHVYKQENNQNKRISKISEIIQDDADRLISSCEDYTAYSKTGHFHFMAKRYIKIRRLIKYCLNLITIDLSSKDKRVCEMVAYVKKHSLKQKDKIILINKEPCFDKIWMSSKWKTICKLGKNKICRLKFELLVLSKLIGKLVSKELFIKSSFNYSDYRSFLIKKGTYSAKIKDYQKIINIPVEPKKFSNFIKEQLKTTCIKASGNFESEGKSVFRNGKLTLKKVTSYGKPDGFELIDKEISKKLTNISLLDIITSICKALNIQDYFAFFGNSSSDKEGLKQIIATLFCYGCNIGAQEVEKSIVDINRKQIGWINATHVSEKSLDKSIARVINTYNQFRLPKYWGDGKHVSVDGTQWQTYTKNLMAQYHIRYRGYGGIAYYHVSDKYIAIFSNFIACGIHEGKYLLDALEENESSIKPEYVHGDHHAQSLVIFGLAYLLGIKIMPRMRKINKVAFYKPEAGHHYGEIDILFKNKKINWKLIDKYTKDMFRVVLSIKEGRIKPSEILSRMNTKNNTSKLYLAFRELGRAIRTIYLLNYISDFDLRKIVHAATCKSEEFNDYVTWVAFSDDIIKKNRRQEQRKFIKYNHLVTNMVLLYNVQAMTVIVKEMIAEGYPVTEDILKRLSPYRKSHIIRLGMYELNLNTPEIPLEIRDFELIDSKDLEKL